MAEGKMISVKRIKIDKASQTIVSVVAVCSFIAVFSLVASKSLLGQYGYQSRVIAARQATVNQLKQDNQSASSLVSSYNSFIGQSTNIIGGNSSGTGDQDGPNNKIILDALPDTFDFPALATSIQNLIGSQGVTITSITGTDTGGGIASSTPVNTDNTVSAPAVSGSTTPTAIPFSFVVSGTYAALQGVLNNLQLSIRPMQILSIDLSGSDSQLTMTVSAQTYYLPAVGVNISSETIK